MIIRGVFSMSIVNRLKHLFKGENKEEKDIKADVSNTSNGVEVTSSKTVKVSISVDKTEDSSKDLTFKKDIEPLEDDKVEEETVVEEVSKSEDVSSEEIVPEAEAEEVELPIEDDAEPEKVIVEESAEEVEETSEEVDADEIEEK